MNEIQHRSDQTYAVWATGLIVALLVFRITLLLLNPTGLHGDEAQYWAWAQDPDFGYYSKPPLIAWIIWTTTAIFGDAEWAVRLASPVLHTITASLCFLTARRLYGAKAGLIAMAFYALMPGVALSSSLISTDAALLVFVALFLYAWVRVREQNSWHWALIVGAAVGFGLLAKYAMTYVLPAFGLAVLFEARTRKAMLNLRGVTAGLLTGLIVLPNLLWNARNDFVTMVHTTDNANLKDGPQFNLDELAEFLFGQLGVFGPVTFILLLIAIWSAQRHRGSFDLWLVMLVTTPLLIICAQAIVSRANANWAAAAYAIAPILLAGWAIQSLRNLRWSGIGLIANLVLGVGPGLVMTSPTLVDRLGFANAVKRQRGWPETIEAIQAEFNDGKFEAIAVDNRRLFYDLFYYGLENTAPLFMWRFEPRLNNHAELTKALPQDDRPVLLVSYYGPYAEHFVRDFEQLTPLDEITINLGGGKTRQLRTYAASGYKGPVYRN